MEFILEKKIADRLPQAVRVKGNLIINLYSNNGVFATPRPSLVEIPNTVFYELSNLDEGKI